MNQHKAKEQRRTRPRATPSGNGSKLLGVQSAEESSVSAEGSGETFVHPSVLVMRIPGQQPGQERIEIAELNGLDPLAVPTVLRIAASIKEQSLGIAERKQ